MPLDLNSNKEPIDQNDQQYQDVLQDLQGNILKSHGRDNSVHIFLTFPNPKNNLDKIRSLKQWIAQLANKDIISTKKQLDDAVAWRNEKRDAGVFVHFSLSSSGYAKLGLPNSQQPKSPNLQNRKTPDEKQLNDDYADVFQDGMKTRQYALLDPPVSAWEGGFQNDIDALVIIAANNLTDVNKKQSEITDQLRNIATIATVEPGLVIRRKFNNTGKNNVVEPFGFTDGVGDPLFFQKDVVEEQGNIAKNLFSARLNLALVQDPFGTQNVSFGSFLVFRKLEQNVQGFKKAEVALGNALGISPQQAGAMVVGRFEDGTPLVQSEKDGQKNLNNFDYSDDAAGLKCPFQAHLRTTNPRLESVRKGGPFAQSQEQELGHRITRRGVTYGAEISDYSNLDRLPKGGVGLLFMCYQSDIWEQFEFIQRFWSNNPTFLEPAMSLSRNIENKNYDRTGLDAVSGQSQPGQSDPVIQEVPQPAQNWLKERDQPTAKSDVKFVNFVTLKGGEYFFSPSISFLKNLPNLPEDFTAPQLQEPIPSKTYVVRQGDDLSKIAQRAYGDESIFTLIYEANKNVIGPNPGSLLAGQILYIPILPTNIRPEPGKEYVVLPNDYLFLIAERAYSDGNRFREIYEANRDVIGPDLTVLVPGQRIRIP
ncbi:MAG: LysM peptidoglycan-binding domain-containing protein [Nostoc sp. ChiQUE02]|uniref:LysM peptidoglycan-binding domain-containing protein n=1 Tax=Nostoc sp. ChiQUE02 TaxID=3075377 RepID=UPI002AD494C2|nr:LysM peptidoglycan-binding domain-containing protein [Nostoc sp. ChiQUE02]MDZ8232050.1 LysM peptidoglycan-binding domain-containing protein [Nostoc sp. ChiQUE02]